MSRKAFVALAGLAALPLGGCVPGLALGAAQMAAEAAQGTPESNEGMQPTARATCSEHASRYGKVHVIDVEQRSITKIVVWGTVDDGKQRRSFECGFKDSMTYFKLREIRSGQ